MNSSFELQAIATQASPPAGGGGVSPPVCGCRAGAALEPAAGDGSATLGGFHSVLIQTARWAGGLTQSSLVKGSQAWSKPVKASPKRKIIFMSMLPQSGGPCSHGFKLTQSDPVRPSPTQSNPVRLSPTQPDLWRSFLKKGSGMKTLATVLDTWRALWIALGS